jgi:hypothetical protein
METEHPKKIIKRFNKLVVDLLIDFSSSLCIQQRQGAAIVWNLECGKCSIVLSILENSQQTVVRVTTNID